MKLSPWFGLIAGMVIGYLLCMMFYGPSMVVGNLHPVRMEAE